MHLPPRTAVDRGAERVGRLAGLAVDRDLLGRRAAARPTTGMRKTLSLPRKHGSWPLSYEEVGEGERVDVGDVVGRDDEAALAGRFSAPRQSRLVRTISRGRTIATTKRYAKGRDRLPRAVTRSLQFGSWKGHPRGSRGRCRATGARAATISRDDLLPRWTVVVPVKGGAGAKSRLHPPAGVARAELALALAADCLTACVAGMPPARVLVVTSDALVRELARALGVRRRRGPRWRARRRGRGPAPRASVRDRGPAAAVAVLLGDLPALRADDLGAALAAAGGHPRVLRARRRRHRHGAPRVTARRPRWTRRSGRGPRRGTRPAAPPASSSTCPRLRTDVDDDRSLAAALALGVGPATGRVLAAAAH